MKTKQKSVGGMPADQVDPQQLQEAAAGMLSRAVGAGAPALKTFADLQQRRATRLKQSAKTLKSRLGADHPAVKEIEALEKSASGMKARLEAQAARIKRLPLLRSHEWVVFGTVLDQQAKPAAGLTVRVFDRDRKYDDLLGETETDADGQFAVVYHERDFMEVGENLAELYVMVSDSSGKTLYSSRDNLRYESGRSEYFAIRLGEKPAATRKKRTAPKG
ncbi:MAG: hypothetical protein JXB85_15520 [Anaerolineales bacterium]|nr:hypothetical protein [Anaerolineales bacterium]